MGRLDLSDAPILPPESEEKYQSAFEILEEVRCEMREQLGLEEYPQPKSIPMALADVDVETLPNDQLGGLYARYVAHAQFVGARLAETEAAYKIATNVLKQVIADVQARLFVKDVPKAEIPTMVRQDGMYRKFDAELVKLYATKTILAAHHRAYDKQASALSRIISLRELEFQQTLRETGIGGKKRTNRAPRRFSWEQGSGDLRKDEPTDD